MLSGTIAVFTAWAATAEHTTQKACDAVGLPALMLSAWGGCFTVRTASEMAFKQHGRSMVAQDVIQHLAHAVDSNFDK